MGIPGFSFRLAAAAGTFALLSLNPALRFAEAQQAAVRTIAFDVEPLAQPELMVLRHTPAFRFTSVMRNFGPQLPGVAQQTVLEGSGAVIPDGQVTNWRLTVEKLALENQMYQAAAPLAVVIANSVAGRAGARFLDADLRGLASISRGAPPNSPVASTLHRNLRAFAAALMPLPPSPIGAGSAALDLNPSLWDFLRRQAPSAQLVKPLSPLVAQGVVLYDGRQAILAQVSDTAAIQYMGRTLTLSVDATAILDLSTALPLMMRLHLRGDADIPFYRGPVGFIAVNTVALPGMSDPVPAAFAFAVPDPGFVPTTLGGASMAGVKFISAGPGKAAPAKPKAPAAAPAAKTAPTVKPAPAAKAAPTAKPADATQPPSGRTDGPDSIARRLENLKSLFDRGLITKEQYEAKQKAILGTL